MILPRAAYSASKRRMKPTWMRLWPSFCLGLDDLPGGLGIRGERLLAEDRDVLGDRLEQDVLVQEAGGGDQHGVDVAVVEGLLGVGEGDGAGDAFDGGLRTGEVDVDDGGNFGAVDAGAEPLDVVRAHAAGADDGDAEGFSHCSCPLSRLGG